MYLLLLFYLFLLCFFSFHSSQKVNKLCLKKFGASSLMCPCSVHPPTKSQPWKSSPLMLLLHFRVKCFISVLMSVNPLLGAFHRLFSCYSGFKLVTWGSSPLRCITWIAPLILNQLSLFDSHQTDFYFVCERQRLISGFFLASIWKAPRGFMLHRSVN